MAVVGRAGALVICVGMATLDQVLEIEEMPRQPVKILASSYRKRGGGPAATAAVACAMLGHDAELWTRMGDDPEGDFVRQRLSEHGIGLVESVDGEGASTVTAMVVVDKKGERFIVGYGHEGLPRGTAHLPLAKIAGAGAILVDVTWPEGAFAALKAAQSARIPSVLDAEGSRREELIELARHSTLPVFSEDGFALIAGGAAPDAASCAAVAEELATQIGVTLGAGGSIWWVEGQLHHVPALPVTAQDTTGAGDVFHGALAAALADRRSVIEAARFASAAAGLKCALGNGWNGMPGREAVEQAMKRLPG